MCYRGGNENNGVDWNYFDRFREVDDKYLPISGEGDNMATQITTALATLVYKWYNDGDVYDNRYYLSGWANDLSDYANWLYEYVNGADEILIRIKEARNHAEYEWILKDLCDKYQQMELLDEYAKEEKVGSIYDCEGPFEFDDGWEEELDDDEEDDW